MITTPTTEVAVVEPELSDAARYALAAFLAGYRGFTRDAYALDLRQFIAWCEEHDVRLFAARRADIECFARDLEPADPPGRQSPVGCARWRASTATPSKKACWSARRRPTSTGHASTTSRMPPA